MQVQKGFTLIELLVVMVIMAILASAAMPLSRMAAKRAREIELRAALRTLRSAIDAFRQDCLPPAVAPGAPPAGAAGTAAGTAKLASDYCKKEQDYYPESLELLTQPLNLTGTVAKTKKYLRRIPRDPMTPLDSSGNPNNWGLRSYSDQPDSTEWGGDDVYDVYSKSDAIALDGSKYNTW